MCECFEADKITPLPSNTRARAREIFSMETPHCDPMFGLEQEFFISRKVGGRLLPVAFPNNQSVPEPQSDYYCGVGGSNVYGRELVLEILQRALMPVFILLG